MASLIYVFTNHSIGFKVQLSDDEKKKIEQEKKKAQELILTDENGNNPLARVSVPELDLFSLLHTSRVSISTFLSTISPDALNMVLQTVYTSLTGSSTDQGPWRAVPNLKGVYASQNGDYEVDVLLARFWFRNSSIVPVPDEVFRMPIYSSLFGSSL